MASLSLLISLSRPYFPSGFAFFPFGVGTTLRFIIETVGAFLRGDSMLMAFFFLFLLLCVILLPTSHHPCAATATLNNDTTFSLSPAFSPLTLSCLFCLLLFITPFPSLPPLNLCFFFSLTTSSFVSVNYIERAVSWLWTGYDSLLPPSPLFFLLPLLLYFACWEALCFRDALGVGCIFHKGTKNKEKNEKRI